MQVQSSGPEPSREDPFPSVSADRSRRTEGRAMPSDDRRPADRPNRYSVPSPETREGIMLKDFKAFLLRGSVVDLAVGIVIGAAFGALVTAFVAAFLTPLIALAAGKADLSNLAFHVGSNPSTAFPYGAFVNALI